MIFACVEIPRDPCLAVTPLKHSLQENEVPGDVKT